MFESSSDEEFVPALLNRPKVANYVVHETFTVDTRDHEDHTFCGVMFDVECRGPADGGVPIEFLEVHAISIRGDLGPIAVWTTPGSFRGKEHSEESWERLYSREHPPSPQVMTRLHLDRPMRLQAGERRGVYVHSQLRGDDAIVYDNERSQVTYEDGAFRVFPGLAHLSNRPFGRHGMWGFPWRERREFVGRFHYGVGYKLWNPEVHTIFPSNFRHIVEVMLLCARRQESPLHTVQDEVIFFILNMCRHDWFQAPPSAASASRGQPSGWRASRDLRSPATGGLRPPWARLFPQAGRRAAEDAFPLRLLPASDESSGGSGGVFERMRSSRSSSSSRSGRDISVSLGLTSGNGVGESSGPSSADELENAFHETTRQQLRARDAAGAGQ